VIYSADFYQGWPTIEDVDASLRPEAGQYIFEIRRSALRYISTTRGDQSNYYAQVEITPQTCPIGGGYGLLFHYQDANNYYALTIFCSGTVTVYSRSEGQLSSAPLLETSVPAGLDPASSQMRTIGVISDDSSFTILVDNLTLGAFSSELLTSGDIALYAASQGGSPLVVAFDNLVVRTIP
jgi:hypothetical protein